ncbi:MAG: hypothetical protein Q7J67_03675, partial [bacterium]|nr:hypothetical protein [bacterium]
MVIAVALADARRKIQLNAQKVLGGNELNLKMLLNKEGIEMLLRGLFNWCLILGLVFSVSLPVFADDGELTSTVAKLQSRLDALEKKMSAQDSQIKSQESTMQSQQDKIVEYESKFSQFEEDLHRVPGAPIQLMEGLELGVGGTMIVQGADNTNYRDGQIHKESRADAPYSADVTLAKEFKEVNGRAFLHLEAGQGAGLEDNLTLYSNVNRDAGDSDAKVELTEFWYEQVLFMNKAVATFGKLDPTVDFDQNEVANDETTQFLGRIFRNSPTVEFPD